MKNTYKSKNDYLKKGKRADVHTTINGDLYEDFQIFCLKIKQPQSKSFDVLIDMVLNDEKLLKEFKNRIKLY